MSADDLHPSFLNVIVDCAGLKAYQRTIDANKGSIPLNNDTADQTSNVSESIIKNIMLFIHSYALLHRENHVCVVALNEDKSTFPSQDIIFPTQAMINVPRDTSSTSTSAICNFIPGSMETLLESMSLGFGNSLNNSGDVNIDNNQSKRQNDTLSLTSTVSMILCAINKLQTTFGSQIQPRILIIQMFPDDPTTYHSMMNCIFSAQKMNVLIDGLILSNKYDSSILQQACFLTGGTYHRHTSVSDFSTLLLVFMYKFLPSAFTRKVLNIPLQESVSFKASCSCHKKNIEFAYVCSVCLTLRCNVHDNSYVCSSCNTPVFNKVSHG